MIIASKRCSMVAASWSSSPSLSAHIRSTVGSTALTVANKVGSKTCWAILLTCDRASFATDASNLRKKCTAQNISNESAKRREIGAQEFVLFKGWYAGRWTSRSVMCAVWLCVGSARSAGSWTEGWICMYGEKRQPETWRIHNENHVLIHAHIHTCIHTSRTIYMKDAQRIYLKDLHSLAWEAWALCWAELPRVSAPRGCHHPVRHCCY